MSIYPTWRLLLGLLCGLPAAIAVAIWSPASWSLIPLLLVALLVLALLDGVFAPPVFGLNIDLNIPKYLGVGRDYHFQFEVTPKGGLKPKRMELRFSLSTLIKAIQDDFSIQQDDQGRFIGQIGLKAHERGQASISEVFIRWKGFLGLVYVQKCLPLDKQIAIKPDLEGIQKDASSLFSRDSIYGLRVQNQLQNGSEFHALREYDTSQDHRRIDWRSSARHLKLLSREFQAERNHHIVLAFDTGRLMGEPLMGLKRLDHAIYAGLLLGYCALKIGDNVKSFGFAARPNQSTPFVSGVNGFEILKQQVSALKDVPEETNHTLALTELSAKLGRRSLIILFSDFFDDISADLMLESLTRLSQKHQILFVAFKEDVLDALVNAAPIDSEDVTRAVFAKKLINQKERVYAQLRRLGIDVLEAPTHTMAVSIVTQYLSLKRANRL